MFFPKIFAGAMLAGACLLPALSAGAAPDQRTSNERANASADHDTFLLLREVALSGNAGKADNALKSAELAARLTDYPIASYVDYYRIKPRLKQATFAEITAFLKRHQGSAIADRLRNDWLLELGAARNWPLFDQQLPLFVLADDLQLKCFALMSRLAKGDKVAAEARELLTHPPAYGEGCNTLLGALAQSGQFDTNDLLAQLRLAGESRADGVARRLAGLLGTSESRAVQAVNFPALAMTHGVGTSRAQRAIYLMALGRLAHSSDRLARAALKKNMGKLNAQERAIGWASIAHAASLSLLPEAGSYWALADAAPLSREQIQWKARTALRHGNWKTLKATIEAMPDSLRSQAVWSYWLARALQAGPGLHAAEVQAMFRRIADPHHFYGQLALEELGQKIVIPGAGAALTEAELAPMASNPGLLRALRFNDMGLRFEASREWNWELRNFSEREMLAAAEFARRNHILDRMVNTSERTRTEFDYTQRFPAPHDDILGPTTSELGLDKAWVYGLIRQESRFITDARSRVGASGLMQVMPATAKYVARKIGLADYVHGKLNDLHTNLLLGTNYLNMVLANADGSQVLASAAYNAGPSRMRKWRKALPEQVEGAIFAETIPFTETRIYVKNVMSNATNYAALFEQRPQSLKARLGHISPSAAASSDLP